MSIHQPIYRFTVYNIAEDGPLVPASGSAHSDSFQVTTVSGSSGWAPYLNRVDVEKGKIIVPEVQYTTGRCICKLADFRTGTDNAERWVTAFIGDADGQNRLVGRKGYVEESLNNGSTWNPLFYGVISSLSLDSPLEIVFTLNEEVVFLSENILDTLPSSTTHCTFHRLTLLPLGLDTTIPQYESVPEAEPILAYVYSQDVTVARLKIRDRDAIINDLNIIDHMIGEIDITGVKDDDFWSTLHKVYLYDTSSNLLGAAGLYKVNPTEEGKRPILHIVELPEDDDDFYDLSSLSKGDDLLIKVVATGKTSGLDFEYMAADNPIGVLKDVIDGEFGNANDHITYSDSNFNTISSSLHDYPPFLMKPTKSYTAQNFVEKVLLQPYLLGYAVVPQSGSSTMKLFSLEMPTSVGGLATITGSDVIANEFPKWNTENPYAFRATTEVDTLDFHDGIAPGTDEGARKGKSRWTVLYTDPSSRVAYDSGSFVDSVLKWVDINCEGMRGLQTYYFKDFDSAVFNKGFGKTCESYRDRFGINKSKILLTCRRTSTVNNLELGDWVILDLEWLPDPNTRERGGTRLVQVTGKNEAGIKTYLEVIDGGITSALSAPSVGIEAYNTNTARISVTASDDAYHRVEYVLLPKGTTSVSATDQRWTFAKTLAIGSSNGASVDVSGVPRGTRVYGRARAQRPLSGSLKLPSSWTTSTGLDITPLPDPSGLTLLHPTYYYVTASWTNGGDYPTEVQSTANEVGSMQKFSMEEAGTTAVLITGVNYAPTTGNNVRIRHRDDYGGVSNWVSNSFNRGAATNQAPTMSGIFIFDYLVWG